MKKGWLIGIIVVVVLLIAFGIYFYSGKGATINCAKQGEDIRFDNEPGYPSECCSGLTDVHTSDSLSIADKCYSTGTETGFPGGVCSNCGDGICDNVESVCGCPQDCTGKGKSTFATIKDFCDNGYNQTCDRVPAGYDLELCNLCK